MTFWQDARPASPRFRMPRRPRSSRSWSRRKRRAALVLIATLTATVGITVVRAAGEATAKTAARPAARRGQPGSPRVVPARWSRTLPDWAASVLTDHRGDAIVIGDSWVSSVALADGALRWQTSVPRVDPRGVLRGDTVLLGTESGFVALDRDTGKVRWQTGTPETPGPVALVGPAGTPPIAVVTTDQGGLVGLDSRTGRARWSVRLSGRMRGMPAVDDASGTIATVWQAGATATQLRLIDGATGALRWEHPLAVMSGSPTIAKGIVAVGAGNGPDDSEVRAFALEDGAPRWRAPVASPFQEDLIPMADGEDLFVVD